MLKVDAKDHKGCTPCLTAALNGHAKAVELLLGRFKAKVTFLFCLFVCYLCVHSSESLSRNICTRYILLCRCVISV